MPGDIIILHLCSKSLNDMIYSSWDIECERLILVIIGHLLPFYVPPPPFSKNQKIKIPKKWKENCRRYHHFTHMYQKTQSLEVQFLRYGRYRDRHNFLKTWAVFCLFTPPNNLEVKILKKWRKHQEISSFETCVPKTTIIWCMLPEIWSATDTFFCHFWPLLLFYFTTDPENQNLEKILKTWRYYPFTHVYHKWRSYDVCFMRWKARSPFFALWPS